MEELANFKIAVAGIYPLFWTIMDFYLIAPNLTFPKFNIFSESSVMVGKVPYPFILNLN